MMLMWGFGAVPLVVVGGTRSSFPVMAAALFVVGVTDGAGMSSGARCCGAGSRRDAGPGLEPGLLRVTGIDAGVDGDRRPAVEGGPMQAIFAVAGLGPSCWPWSHWSAPDAARRNRPPAKVIRLPAEQRWQRQHHDQTPHRWVSTGASTPPVARRSSAHTVPRTTAAKPASVARRQRRDDVEHRRDRHRVAAAERGVERAAEEQFLGNAVDQG